MTAAKLDHSDRDEILRRADLSDLFDALGGRRRGRALHCISPHHEDRIPSASIRRGRFRCFGCGLNVDAIGLVMHVLGLDFAGALRWLAERYGVPMGRLKLTPEERRRYSVATAGADALAQRIADFAHGLELSTERNLAALSAALLGLDVDPTQTLGEFHQQAHCLRRATPRDVAALWAETPPAVRGRFERTGREDRQDAEAVCWAVVDMLAASQRTEAAA